MSTKLTEPQSQHTPAKVWKPQSSAGPGRAKKFVPKKLHAKVAGRYDIVSFAIIFMEMLSLLVSWAIFVLSSAIFRLVMLSRLAVRLCIYIDRSCEWSFVPMYYGGLMGAIRFWTLCFRFLKLWFRSIQKWRRHRKPPFVWSWSSGSIAYSFPSFCDYFSTLSISLGRLRTFARSRSLYCSCVIMVRDNTWSRCE